ncbi:MAG: hypothetical protein Q9202_003430 [Teloschistes flavicans]
MAPVLALCLLLFSLVATSFGQNSSATTLQPVFAFPFDATSTIYASTTTVSSLLDCEGSSLVVSTFSATIAASVSKSIYTQGSTGLTITQETTNTATVTSPSTTSTAFACAPSTSTSALKATTTLPPTSPPTAIPPPRINATAQALIDEIRTAILYVSLIGNDGNLPKLCSVINPSALKNETGINGTAVLAEVCNAASLAVYEPQLAERVVLGNQLGVQYLYTALYAVEVLAGKLNLIPIVNGILNL